MLTSQDIGSRIKYFREVQGLKQEEFGKALFVTQKTVSKWETGKAFPQMDKIVDIASVLHISVLDLLYDTLKIGEQYLTYDCTKEYLRSMRLLKEKVAEDDVYRYAYDYAKMKFKQHKGKFVYKRNLTDGEAAAYCSWQNRYCNNVFDFFTTIDLGNIRYMTCMKCELTMAMLRVYGWNHPMFSDKNNKYYQFSDSIPQPSLYYHR